ncbi:hypothetical protein HF1_07470 [Mycoplasma haemofelis str. Langford 1]|uniref:Uncharacterized protein n=1 Tax=Mycoplasma haemofelis (strain Langford 1) TaxID=941640 RepID=E8ZHY4_MYCHL|nr:hypothetical protein [Mycoplasma haemofelis]CBY92755.1 hypothetical protein HF1_07470 [Mycoplasma haemofelis str. Langford 1]
MLGAKLVAGTSGVTFSACSAYHYACTRTGNIGDALESEGFEFIFKLSNQGENGGKRAERFKKAFINNRDFISSTWKSLKSGSVELLNYEDDGEGEAALMTWCSEAIKQPVRAKNSYLFIFAARWCTLSMEDKLALEGHTLESSEDSKWKDRLKNVDVRAITNEMNEDKKIKKVMDYCHIKKDRVYYNAKKDIYNNLKQFCLKKN